MAYCISKHTHLVLIFAALSVLDKVIANTSTSAPLPSLATHTPKSSSLLKVGLNYFTRDCFGDVMVWSYLGEPIEVYSRAAF